MSRTIPYVFQIGFDFGNLYSKCVCRDLSQDRAFVFTYNLDGRKEFLLSSTVVWENGSFNLNSGIMPYPEHGLSCIKMAVSALAKEKFSSPALAAFSAAAGLAPGSARQSSFVRACCLFHLSRALRCARSAIIARFGDYGRHERDEMYVNMGLPAAYLADERTRKVFADLLERAWDLACRPVPLSVRASLKDMEDLLAAPLSPSDTCNLYPEAAACMQALRRKSPQNVYYVSDAGAGGVEHCCLAYSRDAGQEDRLEMLTGGFFALGSGQIDSDCQAAYAGSADVWRKIKEVQFASSQKLASVLAVFSARLQKCVSQRLAPRISMEGVRASELLDRLYLVFTGGGDMNVPYQS
ncbi:MAG: hypothetical protein Q4F72_06155, partial [Desulfovibrionaceae bacterium]|nr:hypothetical protein [Desulfovibrionaceae bacterium]